MSLLYLLTGGGRLQWGYQVKAWEDFRPDFLACLSKPVPTSGRHASCCDWLCSCLPEEIGKQVYQFVFLWRPVAARHLVFRYPAGFAGQDMRLDLHTRLTKTLGIGLRFIAHRALGAGDEQGRHQSAKPRTQAGRGDRKSVV